LDRDGDGKITLEEYEEQYILLGKKIREFMLKSPLYERILADYNRNSEKYEVDKIEPKSKDLPQNRIYLRIKLKNIPYTLSLTPSNIEGDPGFLQEQGPFLTREIIKEDRKMVADPSFPLIALELAEPSTNMSLERLALFLFLKNFVEKMSTENTELLEINYGLR